MCRECYAACKEGYAIFQYLHLLELEILEYNTTNRVANRLFDLPGVPTINGLIATCERVSELNFPMLSR